VELKDQIENLENDIRKKNDEIATFRYIYRKDKYSKRTLTEIEEMVQVEVNKRKYLEHKIEELKKQIKGANKEIKNYTERYAGIEDKRSELEDIISQQKKDNYQLESTIKDQHFEIDELKVSVIQLKRTIDEQSQTIDETKILNQNLINKQVILTEENTKLKSKLSDTLEANQEMIDNYHLIKDQDQVNKVYYSQIIKNFESTSVALATANKSYKLLKKEADELKKDKEQLEIINTDLDKSVAKKNKEISDLVMKLNSTIQDYEMKLEKKEEEMWALSCQMTNSEMNKSPSTPSDKVMYDMESKWKDKDKVLNEEIQSLTEKILEKDNRITELTREIHRLNQKQFNSRLKNLKTTEQKMTEKINEYILTEEKIEVMFICPRCLSILKKPVTLSPCGHTYCKECMETLREENYNLLYCQECSVTVKDFFDNKILNKICSEFSKRHEITKALMLSISELEEIDKDGDEKNF
jgi:chromosome segregation ATPase